MKTGKTLNEFATEIARRANTKRDFIAPTSKIELSVEEDATNEFERLLKLNVANERFAINDHTHAQLAAYCDIPKAYYDRCKTQDPDLLIKNVNRWVKSKADDKRMIRTLDGTARAFLSNGYRRIENEDLCEAILPTLLNSDEYDIMSLECTDRRLYIKAVGKKLSRELAKLGHYIGDGTHDRVDIVFPAITVTNSEVGDGLMAVESGLYTAWCSNLATFTGRGIRRRHVGARHDLVTDDIVALLSDDTKKKTDDALFAQVRDVVVGAFDEQRFNDLVDEVHGAQADKIDSKADVVEVVKLASTKLGLNDGESKGVLQALIKGGDLSRYGMFNAVTQFAQDESLTYDRASELEKLGASVIEMSKSDWRQIAMAS